jgi:hypothetical protein
MNISCDGATLGGKAVATESPIYVIWCFVKELSDFFEDCEQ